MSFIYRQRNDDDYLIGTPWMSSKKPIVVVVDSSENERERKRLEEEQRRLENFYCGGL